jgi:signal recognition particle receptor subunit beta
MELEEMVKKIKAKPLREEAKKRGIPIHCVNKLDLAKALPVEVVEELAKQSGK